MSKNEIATVNPDLLKKLGAVKADVGMTEVVNVFVTRYEQGLFAKKDKLSADLKAAKKAVEDHEKEVIGTIDRSQYDASVPALGLVFGVTDVSVRWKKSENSWDNDKIGIKVVIGMTDGKDRQSWTKTKLVAMSAAMVDQHNALELAVKSLEGELLETMTLIKSVSRKERELRGRISEMQLNQAGFGELINNEALTSLIAIK